MTENQDDWSGKYLIVFGNNAHATLSGKDLNATKAVSVVAGEIEATSDLEAAVMTVTKNGDSYNMTLPSGKYFGMQHNGCLLSETAFSLGFNYTSSGVEISGTPSDKTDLYYLYNNTNKY